MKSGQFKSIGLLDDTAAYPFDNNMLDELEPTERSVMTLYVHDNIAKAGRVDDLLRCIELLRDNVNNKFGTSRSFDRENGFTAMGSDGRPFDSTAVVRRTA